MTIVYQGTQGFPNVVLMIYHTANAMRFRNIIADALDIVFPSHCVACNAHLARGALLCETCEAAIPLNQTFLCSVCLSRLPGHSGRSLCHPQGFSFGAATDYREDAARDLILALKFKSARAAAEPLARLLARYIRKLDIASPNTILVPVPLSRTRERMRGFNQAEIIAQHASAELHIPVVPNALRRIRDTKPQSDIHERRERSENMRGAFALNDADTIQGRAVIVVDDVRTSGATLGEVVATLRSARPKRIYGIVVARA